MKKIGFVIYLFLLISVIFSIVGFQRAQAVDSKEEIRSITEEAYAYGFPLIIAELTRKNMTSVEKPDGLKAPMNQFNCRREFHDATFRERVRVNVDTLYTTAWLDLTEGPVVLSVPASNRYYILQMLDLWTDEFAAPGSRTTGNGPNNFFIYGPDYKGNVPENFIGISAPTSYVWIHGRIQANGKTDYGNVHSIQDGFKITPYSKWNSSYFPPDKVPYDTSFNLNISPKDQVLKMDPKTFFNLMTELMVKNPPHKNDWSIVMRMKKIGIEPGKPFDSTSLGADYVDVFSKTVELTKRRIADKFADTGEKVNNWRINYENIGTYGTSYLQRATLAYNGLGANVVEDAMYPTVYLDSKGEALNGSASYVIHFSKTKLPPVNAFWSITLYDSQGFFVPNTLNRYALGDRDNLKYNKDGSLDIYIQNRSPGTEKESNWLPSPNSFFNLTMRLYWPKQTAINAEWVPPGITKLSNNWSIINKSTF